MNLTLEKTWFQALASWPEIAFCCFSVTKLLVPCLWESWGSQLQCMVKLPNVNVSRCKVSLLFITDVKKKKKSNFTIVKLSTGEPNDWKSQSGTCQLHGFWHEALRKTLHPGSILPDAKVQSIHEKHLPSLSGRTLYTAKQLTIKCHDHETRLVDRLNAMGNIRAKWRAQFRFIYQFEPMMTS